MLQDLIKNTQYSLLLLNDSAHVTYFSNSDPTTSKDEAHLWKIMKNNPNCFALSYEHAEKLILENPFNIFFFIRTNSILDNEKYPLSN
jgi:hypothetical protein